MNSTLFIEKYIDLYKENDGIEFLWEDEDSLFILSSFLDGIIAKMTDAPENERYSIIVSEAESVVTRIQNYFHDLSKRESLTEIQILRITLLNRLILLFYQQIQKMKGDMDIVNFMLGEKLTQGAFITGLNGPNHQLYLKELLDHERLFQAVTYVAQSKPVLDKYGKSVADSDKIRLSEMPAEELFNVAQKVLQESPNEFLARIPIYKDGFLKEL